jgi:hypothetical protein
MHSIASEVLAPRPVTAPRTFRFASAPAKGLAVEPAHGGARHSGNPAAGPPASGAREEAGLAPARPDSSGSESSAGAGAAAERAHSAGSAAAAPLPTLAAIKVAARAAVLAKAIPAASPPSPVSIFETAPSMASTECSGIVSRRCSAASSTASAYRASVIAASINAAVDQNGWAH